MSRRSVAAALLGLCVACSRNQPDDEPQRSPAKQPAPSAPTPPPELLYVPSAEAELPPVVGGGLLPGAPPLSSGRCPADMVDVRGEFCIDRYEAELFDVRSSQALSPYYHPTRGQTRASFTRYRAIAARKGAPELPSPPPFQLETDFEPAARSTAHVIPSGYLSGVVAKQACERAGKRLCSYAEWLTACRGEARRAFPYGDRYEDGACNVHRGSHPAALLHGNPSIHHLDPRLNRVSDAEGPLLRPTGSLPRCKSAWNQDGAFDMVGNLDEWVEDSFAGGFYARGTRDGCEARIRSHPRDYFDYSLGTRCCR